MKKTTLQTTAKFATAKNLLTEIDQCGAQLRIEQTPAGPELRIGNLRRIPQPLWQALTSAHAQTVACLWQLVVNREKDNALATGKGGRLNLAEVAGRITKSGRPQPEKVAG